MVCEGQLGMMAGKAVWGQSQHLYSVINILNQVLPW